MRTEDCLTVSPLKKLYKLCLLSSDRICFLQDEAGKQMGSNRASTTPLKIKDMRALRDEVVRRYL